jgi:protein-disulfide isomerase
MKKDNSSLSLIAALVFILLLIVLGIYASKPKKTISSYPDGKVVFTEYFDYECPACQLLARDVLPHLEKKYEGKVEFVYKQFPLPQHKLARAAAAGSICADKQEKYKEFRNELVAGYEQWTQKGNLIDTYAEKIGLNLDQYNACKKDSSVEKQIDEDFREGEDRGVNATPTVFINDEKIEGVAKITTYEEKIDALLNK